MVLNNQIEFIASKNLLLQNMNKSVIAWEENIMIPTYGVGTPEKNPMFLEKRVYQGSSGVVYPNAVIEKIYDDKKDKIIPGSFFGK